MKSILRSRVVKSPLKDVEVELRTNKESTQLRISKIHDREVGFVLAEVKNYDGVSVDEIFEEYSSTTKGKLDTNSNKIVFCLGEDYTILIDKPGTRNMFITSPNIEGEVHIKVMDDTRIVSTEFYNGKCCTTKVYEYDENKNLISVSVSD